MTKIKIQNLKQICYQKKTQKIKILKKNKMKFKKKKLEV